MMEQLPERASSRLGGAGLERHSAQPDEADNSEPRRRKSWLFTEIKPENEKVNDGFRAHSRGDAEEAPSSSSHRKESMARSHYNEPHVGIAAANLSPQSQNLKTLSERLEAFLAQREELRKEILELPTDLGHESEKRLRDADLRMIELNTDIKNTTSAIAFADAEIRDAERQDPDASQANDVDGAPSRITEYARSESGQLALPHTMEKLRNQRHKTTAPQPPNPEVGDVLVAIRDFTARSSHELNLAKGDEVVVIEKEDESGDGRILGENLSTGRFGLFPKIHSRLEARRPLARSEDSPTVHSTVQTQLSVLNLNQITDQRPGSAPRTVSNNSASSVCGRCGARRDPRTGCSCKGMQDGLGGQRSMNNKYPKRGMTDLLDSLLSKQALKDPAYPFTTRVPDDVQKLRELCLTSNREMDLEDSQPGDHADKRHEYFNGPGETSSDEAVSRPKAPPSPPIPLLPESSASPSSSPSYPWDGWDVDNDDGNDDEVVVVEEHKPSASLYTESNDDTGSSVGHADSKASFSTKFSEKSREQPTDPSSWLCSLSKDQADKRGCLVDATFSGTQNEHNLNREVDECNRSISSVADSIGSAVSDGGSLGQAGVNYVVAKFTQSDPELLALYTKASQRLTKDRFVDNNRRLLKMFYLDFTREEQTPSQREAVAFFKSRRRRAEISLDILRSVIPDHDANCSVEGNRKEFSMLNAYFETLDAAEPEKGFEDEQGALESDESEAEDAEEQPSLDMTSLQAIGEYFVTSRAFSQYKQRLHKFLHPNHGDENESADIRGAHSNREERLMEASRALGPGAKPLIDTSTGTSLKNRKRGTGNQVEEHLNGHEADDIRNIARTENFQQSSARHSLVQSRRMPWEGDSFSTYVTKWVTGTLWPPTHDSQRIWYLCGCGQHIYIDIKELMPGGVESEWRSISESSATATGAHSPQNSASSGVQLPATPSPVHLGPNSSRNTACQTLSSQETPNVQQPQLNPASAISPDPATRRDPMFLLICINGKAYKTLAELRCLDINDSYNDELLIRGILDQYEQARKGRQWTIDLLLPKWMKPAGLPKHLGSIWERFPVSVRSPSIIRESLILQFIPEWWSKWTSDVSPWAPLHIVDTADFVEFELVPHPEGKEAFPSHFTSGRWPAPDNKQYSYRPVPMKCIKTMNLWHMRRPGPHTEVYWYNTVPKKVDGALYRPSGTVEDVVGYGVRINERLNDVLILWWSFIFILVTGVFIYVYARCTNDNSSAFGMGAYLVAAFTVYIQLQYAWWKRT